MGRRLIISRPACHALHASTKRATNARCGTKLLNAFLPAKVTLIPPTTTKPGVQYLVVLKCTSIHLLGACREVRNRMMKKEPCFRKALLRTPTTDMPYWRAMASLSWASGRFGPSFWDGASFSEASVSV